MGKRTFLLRRRSGRSRGLPGVVVGLSAGFLALPGAPEEHFSCPQPPHSYPLHAGLMVFAALLASVGPPRSALFFGKLNDFDVS